MTSITGTLHQNRRTFMIISRWILLRMRNASDKSCRENRNAHYMFKIFFFSKWCLLWDNVENFGRARQATNDNIIRRMHFVYRITKASDTLKLCNTYCFSTPTVVKRTRLCALFRRVLPVLFPFDQRKGQTEFWFLRLRDKQLYV